jgi:glycosyltransferase involved in cell wall biosynthesis
MPSVSSSRRSPVLLLEHQLTFGGTEGQFVEIACGLDRSRWDLHVGCVRAEGPRRAKLDAAGLRVWSWGRGSFKSPRFAVVVVELARFLRAHRIRVVHAFDFYSNILGVLAARLARVPVVIASQRDLGNLRPPLQRRVHNVVLRLADYVVVNTQAVADSLQHDGIVAPTRLVVIPNGVDATRFSGTPGEARPSGHPIIGTLAVLRPEKGLADFVRAAAHVVERFPDARFVIWGEGLLRSPLEELVRDLGLSGAVALAGATLEPEAALRELDIFVLPSLSEACSNALLEAMATGRAVVATRVGGNPALIEDEVTGLLVPAQDPAALAKAVIRLLEEPALAAGLAARAQKRVRAEFGIERMLAHVQSLYDRALAERGI